MAVVTENSRFFSDEKISLRVMARKNRRFLCITVRGRYDKEFGEIVESMAYAARKSLLKEGVRGDVVLDIVDFTVVKTVSDILRYDFIVSAEFRSDG